MTRQRIKIDLNASGLGRRTCRSIFPVVIGMALQMLVTAAHGATTTSRAVIHPAKSHSVVYTGEVNAKTAWRFVHLIADNEGKNLSLDIVVKDYAPEELEKFGYYAGCDGQQLAISVRKPGGGEDGFEVVRNQRCKSVGGRFRIIGEFFVRGGGFTQGTLSFGLEPSRRGRARLTGEHAKIRVHF